MKKLAFLLIAIFAINLCIAQDIKVVGGNEKNINVQRGESEWFEVSLKNVSSNTIYVKNIRCDKSEISTPELGSGEIVDGDKRKYKFRVTPKHSGKQRFQVYVDYESDGGKKGKAYFVVAINPRY